MTRRFFWFDASPTDAESDNGSATDPPTRALSVMGRRIVAWSLELGLLTASIAVPLEMGGWVNARAAEPRRELSPALQWAQRVTARQLGLSPRSLPTQVAPFTNLLWSVALGAPMVLASLHLYQVARRGASGPKRWLGVQVVTLEGRVPGWRRALLREGLGKWGGPIAIAYGLWQVSGAFPTIILLTGLGAVALVGEGLTALGNRPRRAWHDWLAGTCVVDRDTGAIVRLESLMDQESPLLPRSQRRSAALTWMEDDGGLTSVVLNPLGSWHDAPWHGWGRRAFSLGLSGVLLLGALAGVGGTHLLSQWTGDRSRNDTLFVNLVATLTNPAADASARRAAVLALGNLPDDRVTPLLVDLIAQANDPQWLDALHQAIVKRGPEAVPDLRRLNRSLSADLNAQRDPARRRQLMARLQTVNRVLTKLIVLTPNTTRLDIDLSGLHLGQIAQGDGEFVLVLRQQNLAGVQGRGAILNRAQLQGARFFHPGTDNHYNTYDDWVSDLSGADLTEADLTGADLSLAQLSGASLLRATLSQANLSTATLNQANLERSRLIQATLTEATLIRARLTAADLTAAQLQRADFTHARLQQVTAAGANFSEAVLHGATLRGADLTDADLTAADLHTADLEGARLRGANLRGADLRQANLRDADLQDVWLHGADLTGTDFAGAVFFPAPATGQQGFVEDVPSFGDRQQFDQVDFSEAQNLNPDQLAYICAQGGIHPACDLSGLTPGRNSVF